MVAGCFMKDEHGPGPLLQSSAVEEGMAMNGFMEDECAGRDKSSHALAEQEAELFR